MNVTAVESSTLATIAYDGNRELLQLEFNSRAVYQYLGVPAVVYEELLRTPSKAATSIRPSEGNSRTGGVPVVPERSLPAEHRR